jgi:hypothetical protein
VVIISACELWARKIILTRLTLIYDAVNWANAQVRIDLLVTLRKQEPCMNDTGKSAETTNGNLEHLVERGCVSRLLPSAGSKIRFVFQGLSLTGRMRYR